MTTTRSKEYGPPKTLYNRWKRWSDKGVFARMMYGLAAEAAVPKTVMIDATYLKAHRTATSLRSSEAAQTSIRQIKQPSLFSSPSSPWLAASPERHSERRSVRRLPSLYRWGNASQSNLCPHTAPIADAILN
jgi:hypothetical protein